MRRIFMMSLVVAAAFAVLSACATANATGEVPGAEKTSKTKALEVGARVVQEKSPLNAMNMYLNGFHFHSGDMKDQMTAYHYCSSLSEEVTQCAVYDGDSKTARLIGVEYIVSERLFAQLPDKEKKLWHSHRYEVKSGVLVAPGIPLPVEHQLMEKIVSTYGKTWHTWDSHRDDLPLGIPSLMMGFTADGQLDPQLLRERDQKDKIDTAEHRKDRESIPTPKPVPGADAWQSGTAPQLDLSERRVGSK